MDLVLYFITKYGRADGGGGGSKIPEILRMSFIMYGPYHSIRYRLGNVGRVKSMAANLPLV